LLPFAERYEILEYAEHIGMQYMMNLIIAIGVGVITALILAYVILLMTVRGVGLLAKAAVAGGLKALRNSVTGQDVSTVQKRKEAMQKTGPKTFYYIDESQVKDLYPQVFQELEPTRIESRESKEIKKGIAAKLKLIEPKYERDRGAETTKIYDVEKTPSMMYNKIEEYLVEKEKITFGLEEFEFKKSSIDEFKSMCAQMRSKFDFNIPDGLQANFVSDKMKEFALQRVKELSRTSGYVVIQTEFSITDILYDDYLLSFVHPLNEYLPQEDTKVRIQVTCAKKYMLSSGVSAFKKGKTVKISSLGKVVSWNDGDKILEISPIAIY
jgi:hypothetical protein